jgi:hypothetical protein
LWLLVPGAILLAHAWIWPQGTWQDEWFTYAMLRLYGWRASLFRLLHWSGRPFSEALINLQLLAIVALRRPLVTPSLGLAWGIWIGVIGLVARPWRGPGRLARWALLLGLPAACLLSSAVANLYYWPIGSVAYLPALGAVSAAVVLLAGPGLTGMGARVVLCALLSLGAASVEMGGMLALALAPLLGMIELRDRAPRRVTRVALAVLPGLVAAATMAVVVAGRVAPEAVNLLGAASFHNPWRSLLAAVPLTLRGLVQAGWRGPPVWVGLLTKGFVFAGAYVALGQAWPARPARAPLVALLVALAAVQYLSVASALYQFGGLCCERHASYRQALTLLMLVCSAGLARPVAARVANPHLAPALLALALAWAAPARLRDLRAEAKLAPQRAAAMAEIFASGNGPGDTVDYVMPPNGPILPFGYIKPGTYILSDKIPWFVQGPMFFFDKKRMVVERR